MLGTALPCIERRPKPRFVSIHSTTMPSPSSSRRVEQCVFTEDGRRCRRSGLGDPPVCNAHRVAFVEAARAGAKPKGARAVGDGIYDLIDRLVSGKKVTKKVAREAFKDARNTASPRPRTGGRGNRHHPPIPRRRNERSRSRRSCELGSCSASRRASPSPKRSSRSATASSRRSSTRIAEVAWPRWRRSITRSMCCCLISRRRPARQRYALPG